MKVSKLLLAKLEKRLTLKDLAALSGRSESHISRVLRNERGSEQLNRELAKLFKAGGGQNEQQ